MATFCLFVYLFWALFAIPATMPGDSFLDFPSSLIGLLKHQWAHELWSVFFKNFWFYRHFEIRFHVAEISHSSLRFPWEMLGSDYWKRNTFYSLERPVPRRWGQKGRGRQVGGSTLRKASTDSFKVAKINTYKVFSIKVPYIWLHKHNTNCKNKAKDFMLISSIKTVSLWAFGKWSYEGLTDISVASQCSYKSVNTEPASYCLVCWGCCGKHSAGWVKETVLRNKTSPFILTLNSCWKVCSHIPSLMSLWATLEGGAFSSSSWQQDHSHIKLYTCTVEPQYPRICFLWFQLSVIFHSSNILHGKFQK